MKATAILCLLLLWSVSSATVINVPSDQATIQAAVNIATEGDTVLVAPGTYTGDGNRRVILSATNIVIMAQGDPESTVIDCQGTESDHQWAFLLPFGNDTTTVIKGFTITNAYSVWDTAAVTAMQSSVTLRDCRIVNNHNKGFTGNGIWDQEYWTIVEGCYFANNGWNAGLYTYAQYLRIFNSEFAYNGWEGVSTSWNLGTYITGCLFHHNGRNGLFMAQEYSDIQVEYCTFVSNGGNGIEWDWNPPKNDGPAQPSNRSDSQYVAHCITAFNGEDGIWIGWPYVGYTSCNNSFGNSGVNFRWWDNITEQGNISADPLFCDTSSNHYALDVESPCAPENNSCGMHIGAFPVGCTCCQLRGDVNHDGSWDIADIVYLVDYMFNGGPEPPCMAEADINGAGDGIDIADLVYLIEAAFGGGPGPYPCYRVETYEYQAYDGAVLVATGELYLEWQPIYSDELQGKWRINGLESINVIGPQDGYGTMHGVCDSGCFLNLNPDFADFNVYLSFEFLTDTVNGTWQYHSFAGLVNEGTFVAVRRE